MRHVVMGALACLISMCPLAWAQDGAEAPRAMESAVRVAYLVADGMPVYVRVGVVTIVSPAEAGTVSGYRLVRSGEQEVTILDASDDAEGVLGPASVPAVGRATGAFEPGAYYTVIVIDRAERDSEDGSRSGSSDGAVDVHIVSDRLETYAGAGEARVRMLNVLPGGASWSVYGDHVGEERASSERSHDEEIQISEAVPYGGASPWVGVPMGIYVLHFDGESEEDVLPAALEVVLHGGTIYTAFVYAGSSEERPRVAIRVDAVVRAGAGPPPVRPGGPP